MVIFDFTPRREDLSWGPDWQPRDPATRSVVGLRELPGSAFIFECFQVNVMLVIGELDFSLEKTGIPVLDFALMLDGAVKDVKSSGISRAETSISQDVFQFRFEGDLVEVTSSSTVGTAAMSIEELDELVDGMFERAMHLLYAAHPGLVDNRYLTSLAHRFRRGFSP